MLTVPLKRTLNLGSKIIGYLLRVLLYKKHCWASFLFTWVFWERSCSVSEKQTKQCDAFNWIDLWGHKDRKRPLCATSPAFHEPLSDLVFHGLFRVVTLHIPQLLGDSHYTLLIVVFVLLLFNPCVHCVGLGGGFCRPGNLVAWIHGLPWEWPHTLLEICVPSFVASSERGITNYQKGTLKWKNCNNAFMMYLF